MFHILDRFVIHFASSFFIMLIFFFLLKYWATHNHKVYNWVSPEIPRILLTCALFVATIFPIREAWDIYAQNNSITKAYTDILSWWAGAAVSAWGLYRFRSRL